MATLTIELDDAVVSVLEEFCVEVKSNVPELINRLVKDAASDTTAVLFNYYPECLSEDTWEALRESEEILKNPSAYPGYHSAAEMRAAILAEFGLEDYDVDDEEKERDDAEVYGTHVCKVPA